MNNGNLLKHSIVAVTAAVALSLSAWASAQTGADSEAAPSGEQNPDITTERYKDWALSCRTDQASGDRQCSMFQRLVIQETNQVALNVAIGFLRSEDGNRVPVAIFTFPLGIFLPGGAEIQVDDAEPFRLQIERCFRRGCQSGVALDDAHLAQFRAGSQANVKIMQDRGQAVDLTVSLSGFSAAYNALIASVTAD